MPRCGQTPPNPASPRTNPSPQPRAPLAPCWHPRVPPAVFHQAQQSALHALPHSHGSLHGVRCGSRNGKPRWESRGSEGGERKRELRIPPLDAHRAKDMIRHVAPSRSVSWMATDWSILRARGVGVSEQLGGTGMGVGMGVGTAMRPRSVPPLLGAAAAAAALSPLSPPRTPGLPQGSVNPSLGNGSGRGDGAAPVRPRGLSGLRPPLPEPPPSARTEARKAPGSDRASFPAPLDGTGKDF